MNKMSARGIVIKDEKVLLMFRRCRGKEYYSIPGGKMEPGESLEQTVVREVLEETSVEVAVVRFLGKFKHKKRKKEQHIYLCEYLSGEPKLGDSNEMRKMAKDAENYYHPEWVAIEKVAGLTIQPKIVSEFFKEKVASNV